MIERIHPEDKGRAIEYFGGMAAKYETTVSRGPLKWFRQRERRAVCDLLFGHGGEALAGKTLLDVGCGSGYYSLRAKRLGMHVTSMDVVPEMLRRLSSTVDATLLEDVETATLDRRFDRVICAGVLDFVVSPERGFANLARWVAPGGILVVLVPSAGIGGSLYGLEKALAGIRVNRFPERWVIAQARTAGLTLTSAVTPLPFNRVYLFSRAQEPKSEILHKGVAHG